MGKQININHGSKGIFLSIKDLMLLNGSDSYVATQREHSALRSVLEEEKPKMKKRLAGRGKCLKRKITIREYCEYMQLDYQEVWDFLRGETKNGGQN